MLAQPLDGPAVQLLDPAVTGRPAAVVHLDRPALDGVTRLPGKGPGEVRELDQYMSPVQPGSSIASRAPSSVRVAASARSRSWAAEISFSRSGSRCRRTPHRCTGSWSCQGPFVFRRLRNGRGVLRHERVDPAADVPDDAVLPVRAESADLVVHHLPGRAQEGDPRLDTAIGVHRMESGREARATGDDAGFPDTGGADPLDTAAPGRRVRVAPVRTARSGPTRSLASGPPAPPGFRFAGLPLRRASSGQRVRLFRRTRSEYAVPPGPLLLPQPPLVATTHPRCSFIWAAKVLRSWIAQPQTRVTSMPT